MTFKHTPLIMSVIFLAAGPRCFDAIGTDLLAPRPPGEVVGVIVDSCTNRPVPDVIVFDDHNTPLTKTDKGGQFRLSAQPSGSIELSFVHVAYQTSRSMVTVIGDEIVRVSIAMSPPQQVIPLATKVDVLWVVDNTSGMASVQDAIGNSIDGFIQVLFDNSIDLRMGVVSTDLGADRFQFGNCHPVADADRGKLLRQNSSRRCVADTTQDGAPFVQMSVAANVAARHAAVDQFRCLVHVGTSGCGFEQPLLATQAALQHPVNLTSFFRSDALTLIVIATNEDDCSAVDANLFDPSDDSIDGKLGPLGSYRCFEQSVSCDLDPKVMRHGGTLTRCHERNSAALASIDAFAKWATALNESKKNSRGLFLATLAASPVADVTVGIEDGTPAVYPTCRHGMRFGAPAFRLKAMTDKLYPRSFWGDVCSGDMSATLRSLATSVKNWIFSGCNR